MVILNPWILTMKVYLGSLQWVTTYYLNKVCFGYYLIVEQGVLSEQALNSKTHLACFLFFDYVISNKQEGIR